MHTIHQKGRCDIGLEGTTPYLDGSLLGDGTLEPYKEISARLQIRHQIAHAEYNLWFMEKTSESLRWYEPSEVHQKGMKIEGRAIVSGRQHSIRTRYMMELVKARKRWYPESKKIVPSDLVLTPETVAVWYMDDGSLGFSRPVKNLSPVIVLYTAGFGKEGSLFLSQLLLETFGIKSSVHQNRASWQIAVSGRTQVEKFVKLVSPTVSQVACMRYKIDLSRLPERERKHLTEAEVKEMRSMRAAGMKLRQLALQFQVGMTTVKKYIRKEKGA